MLTSNRSSTFPVVYEVAPFRHVWIVRRRGSKQETLYLTREEALDRARALCRTDEGELVILDPPRTAS